MAWVLVLPLSLALWWLWDIRCTLKALPDYRLDLWGLHDRMGDLHGSVGNLHGILADTTKMAVNKPVVSKSWVRPMGTG